MSEFLKSCALYSVYRYIDAYLLLYFLTHYIAPGWPGAHYVGQASLKLTEICLPLSP